MRAARAAWLIAIVLLGAGGALVVPAGGAGAAAPAPTPDPAISLVAEPMLGGTVRPGSWAAVRVTVANSGPAVEGELRMSPAGQDSSTVGVGIHLATGARQQHVLYGRTAFFRSRFDVSLVSGDTVLASAGLPIEVNQAASPAIGVIAERPQALAGPVRDAASSGGQPPAIVSITPEDLPPRAEPWSSLDVLVWQDVESQRLSGDQLEALRTWVATGGHLVVLGGTTGVTTVGAFPAEMLPYRPSEVVEVPVADLPAILGAVPENPSPMPALTGRLERGVALASSGAAVVAARTTYGEGSVAVIGLDPSTAWLAGTAAADAFWARILPSRLGRQEGQAAPDDGFLIDALGSLPAVQLPRLEHVFLLIVAYIVTIGPLNYVLLRRRDRREWAWVTMPAAIVVFAIAAYAFGASLRGASVVINELAVVHGAAGTDRGLAEVHVGIFSPGRASFDVSVGGDVLVSAPATGEFGDPEERPVDVLLGDPTTLRGYGVGFGALRSFRAETAVPTPLVNADLQLVEGSLEGTLTNGADAELSDVSVVYGNGLGVVGSIAPGESRPVSLTPDDRGRFEEPLSWRLFPAGAEDDAAAVRTKAARRAVIQHLAGGWDEGMPGSGAGVFGSGPVILAWQSVSTLEIGVGAPAEHVGERLFVLRAPATVSGPVVFSGDLIQHSTLAMDAVDAWEEFGTFSLTRGTLLAEYRPAGFDGSFVVSELTFRLGRDSVTLPSGQGEDLAPLPAAEQPDPDSPLASNPRPDAPASVPRVQLFDRTAETWVELEPADSFTTYRVPDPTRYVDESGAFRVRFVVRGSDYVTFSFAPRLAGTVE